MSETTRTGRQARTVRDASRHQKPPVCEDREDARPASSQDSRPVGAESKAADAVEQRVMTDGGRDPVDPDRVPEGYTPAVIQLSGDGEIFVANYTLLSSGWVSVTHWDREREKYPPHQINKIGGLRTERYGERRSGGSRPKRLATEDRRERARRLAQPTETYADQEAIADGGER